MKAIMYHYIRPDHPEFPYFKSLHVEDFEKQLDYFQETYGFVSKKEFLESLQTGQPVDGVVLTFDDGFKDHYQYVMPTLLKRNLWGVFYINTGVHQLKKILDVHRIHLLLGKYKGKEVYEQLSKMLEKGHLKDEKIAAFKEDTYKLQDNDTYTALVKRTLNYYVDYKYREVIIDQLMDVFFEDEKSLFKDVYLTPFEMREMHEKGMIIGSHTVHHPVMSKLDLKQQEEEILDSFAHLSSHISNFEAKTFCYPYGGFHTFTNETIKLLDKHEVEFSFNVESRDITAHDLKSKKQALPRYDCNEFPYGSCRNL
jgi:peptidoglycan/xylan/chitin deacetylase (PgdA/CDA1 family)